MRLFGIDSQLLDTDAERRAHIDALKKLDDEPDHARLFDFLYQNLSILDSKASTLLSFNSVVLAVVAIIMTGTQNTGLNCFYFLSMLCLLVSCILCLCIVWIHWSTTDDMANIDQHASTLLKVRFKRTREYRIAWWLSLLSVLMLAVATLLRILFRCFYGS